MKPRTASLLKIVLLISFVAGAVGVFRFTSFGQALTPGNLRDLLDEFDPLAKRLLYIGGYILGTVLFLPGTLLSFLGAVLFGFWEGTLYTWIGATLGATAAFLLAKALGRDYVNSLLKGRMQALDERLRAHGFLGLLIMRLVPLFPFNGLNYGAGLTAIRFRDYFLATVIGLLPGIFVYQFLFARLGDKLVSEGFAWSDLWDPALGLALLLFVAFTLAGRCLAKRLS